MGASLSREGLNPGLAIFFLFFSPKCDKKWVLAWLSFGECTARVKLELNDFSIIKLKLLLKQNYDWVGWNDICLSITCIELNKKRCPISSMDAPLK